MAFFFQDRVWDLHHVWVGQRLGSDWKCERKKMTVVTLCVKSLCYRVLSHCEC